MFSISYVLGVEMPNVGEDRMNEWSMPLDKGTAPLEPVRSLLSLPHLFLLSSSVPFSLSNKPLLLISDEPSLSFLSHAEKPLWCGHLLPEGVSKPPAGTLQPDSGKPSTLPRCLHAAVFWGE